MADGEAIVSIRERLLKERHALLDLSTRNRLLNTPLRTKNNRAVEIVDEKSIEVFRILTSGKAMSFSPGVQLSEAERGELDADDDVTGGVPQPEDGEAVDERGMASRHTDTRLQTRLTSEGLQKRLLDILYDAQTLEQDQGVNILYLAVGLLRWFDSDSSDIARHAPLVLLPVKLERTSAADRFKLRWRDEPPSPNLTLQAKMKAEFGLAIEDFKDEDEVDLAAYCARVADTVASKARWEVLPDAMVLGFFSFAKFLMYRDLDPDNWPKDAGIDAKDMIGALLRDGFAHSEPLVPDGAALDDIVKPLELHHVVDADSSQTVVIAEAAGGRSLVVKGPPGTGKSQTITNIIAAAAARGKKVLFVAEKMAALEVVHRRLQKAGLGPLTLQLHSNKVNKRVVLEDLKRTRDAQLRPQRSDVSVVQKLGDSRDQLNQFALRLHERLEPCGLSPHAILGRLAWAKGLSVSADFRLEGAEAWTSDVTALVRMLVEEVAQRRAALGSVAANPWRGARCDQMDPTEREALGQKFSGLAAILADIRRHCAFATEILGAPVPDSVGDLNRTPAFLAVSPLPKAVDRDALTDAAWADIQGLANLIAAGRSLSSATVAVAGRFNDAGHGADYRAIRSSVVVKGASLFRFLDGGYRASLALLKSYVVGELPTSQSDRLALIDQIMALQAAEAAFETAKSVQTAFGSLWRGPKSDWDALERVLEWRIAHEALPSSVWSGLAGISRLAELDAARSGLATAAATFDTRLKDVLQQLDLDSRRAFGGGSLQAIPLSDLDERIGQWGADLEGLSRFTAFATRAKALENAGAATLVDGLYTASLDDISLPLAFERSYAEVLRTALFKAWPELRAFDGDGHNRLVEDFRRLDRARIDLAQEQIVEAHAAGRPQGASGIGPLGVLNAEMAKKRGHLPIRGLLEKAGPAIQQLKPVFMMSPLSVAQFLKPGGLHFDLLVMDEASQIEPVDALGAIARADQIVVVGDDKQLPPTAFFKKLTGEDDPEEVLEDGITIQAKDAESILDLALAKGLPSRMLEWHYRSKHQSLIAVSNREFYENRLFIVPSPYDAIAGMGLKFNLLKDTAYGRGESRTNPKEARAVAEAVIEHARSRPDQSLGVATFSVAQRQAIQKELELLRRANPDVEEFFGGGSHEPFFVKNLENIQGDERDVIYISVGYGKTETGYLAHAFGPLSGEGGERRLNVLISRAKLRCEVFCNFTGADIDLERTRSRGGAALKLFLTFAETGHFGLGEVTGEDFDSEFEADVCTRLQALGYDVKRQIGASGFRVDLAVSDPEKPGRFVLGIECDGAQFHSSRSARDRDRLRQEVLEAHGWIIHRVWSADWYLRPQAELKKIEAALSAARDEWNARDEEGIASKRAVPVSFESERIDDVDYVTAVMESSTPFQAEQPRYVEAAFLVNRSCEPHETPLAGMAAHVVKIVETEGPIHLDEIVARIRILWGLGRAGSRIRASVQRAVEVAWQQGLIEAAPFYSIPGQPVIIRDRSLVGSPSLRRPEALPPVEIDQALLRTVDANFGASEPELIQAVSRSFGFAATSAQLRSVLSARVEHLVQSGDLARKGDLLTRS